MNNIIKLPVNNSVIVRLLRYSTQAEHKSEFLLTKIFVPNNHNLVTNYSTFDVKVSRNGTDLKILHTGWYKMWNFYLRHYLLSLIPSILLNILIQSNYLSIVHILIKLLELVGNEENVKSVCKIKCCTTLGIIPDLDFMIMQWNLNLL